MEELNVNELLKVEQIPKVYEDLEKIGIYLDEQLKGIDDIECTEENKQDVKKKRALVNNTLTVLETKRKEIKNIILKPYDNIEKKFNNNVKEKITNALEILDKKIAFIEDKQKENIKEQCESYFCEYALSKDVDFVTFKDLSLNITLGLATEKGSLTKKAKETIENFINKIVDDIELINSQQYVDEMMIEYKKDLNVSKAITEVNNRHIELEKAQQEKEEQKEQKLTDEVMLNKIESLSAPKVKKQEEILELTFKVRGTKEKLKLLKQFLENGEYDYE